MTLKLLQLRCRPHQWLSINRLYTSYTLYRHNSNTQSDTSELSLTNDKPINGRTHKDSIHQMMYTQTAVSSLQLNPLLNEVEFDEWFKDFHFLFQHKCYHEIANQKELVLSLLDTMRPTEISMVIHHYAECKLIETEWWIRFSNAFKSMHMMDMTGRDIASIFNSLKKVNVSMENLKLHLLDITSTWVDMLDMRSAAVAALSCCENEVIFNEFYRRLAHRISNILNSATPTDIIMCLKAYKRGSAEYSDMRRRLLHAFHPFIIDATPNHLALVASEGVSEGVDDCSFWESTARRLLMLCQLKTISHYQFAHIVDALLNINFTCEELREAIKRHFIIALKQSRSSYDATRLFASVYYQHIELSEEDLKEASIFLEDYLRKTRSFNFSLIVTLVMLRCALNASNWEVIARSLSQRKRDMQWQMRLCAFYCCTYIEWRDHKQTKYTKLMQRLCEDDVCSYDEYGIVMYSLAYATMGGCSNHIWSRIVDRAIMLIPRMDSSCICLLVASLCLTNVKAEELFTACVEQIQRNNEIYEVQHLRKLEMLFQKSGRRLSTKAVSITSEQLTTEWGDFLWKDPIFKDPLKYLRINKSEFLHTMEKIHYKEE